MGHHQSFTSPSLRSVSYSCGSCGYDLNLSSSNRNTSTIDSKYGKSIKRGIVSFVSIDESRFTFVDEFQCIPNFSKGHYSLFRHKTQLLCGKCHNLIGIAYDDESRSPSTPGKETSARKRYDVRIRALQPSSSEQIGV